MTPSRFLLGGGVASPQAGVFFDHCEEAFLSIPWDRQSGLRADGGKVAVGSVATLAVRIMEEERG